MKKIAHPKSRRTKKSSPANDAPIPFRPVAVERERLAPIEGAVGPRPLVLKERPNRPITMIEAEKVTLPSYQDPRTGSMSVGSLLQTALGIDVGQDVAGLERAMLFEVHGDLEGVSYAIRGLAEECGAEADPVVRLVNSIRDRIGIAMELAERYRSLEWEGSKPAFVAIPTPRDVAAALLTTPGVLAAPSEWDRLLRVSDLLGRAVEEDDREDRCLLRREGTIAIPLALTDEHRRRYVVVDRAQLFALFVAGEVAHHGGYAQHALHDWRRELAGLLLGRDLPPARDTTKPTVRKDAA